MAKIDGRKETKFVGGRIADGKCRKKTFRVELDTESREHFASTKLMGFLNRENIVFNGGGQKEKVQCNANDDYKTRFQYATDCKLTVSTYIATLCLEY